MRMKIYVYGTGCGAGDLIDRALPAERVAAFYGCTGLGGVDLATVSEVGKSAFSECTSLASADLSGVSVIGDHAFYNCALASADLSAATTIGLGAFTGNPLSEVVFGQSLQDVDSKAFFRISFQDVNGGKIKVTVDDMVGKTFMGQGRILTQTA